ncbi:MAG: AAA family ATPase [Tolypothrix brevis GSE-NOS-MK-07-07A]|nr:AAA family ATPase [Tolypothrix brevis GSE-NOS-MK-07-07A]
MSFQNHLLQETGEIKSFPIAQRDVCDRFLIPDKLYGRETEVKTLLQAFERVSLDATEMMLVAGFSGIAKTVVVNERSLLILPWHRGQNLLSSFPSISSHLLHLTIKIAALRVQILDL